MRSILILSIFILSLFLFGGCKSKSSSCACPYQSNNPDKIKNITIELDSPTLLSLDSTQIDLNKILPSNYMFEPEQLLSFITTPILPLYRDVIDKAFEYEGVRYRRGGTSTRGMDCSGLVYTCFSALGISLPRSSFDMAKSVSEIPKKDVRKGDLIFFKTNRRHGRINHVGLVIEANNHEIKFIHASIQKGVIVSSTLEDYYARSFVKVGRVFNS